MAALRAAGAAEPDPALRNPDWMAREFVPPGPTLDALVLVPGVRRLVPVVAERVLPGAYPFETARVKHMDAVLRRELAGGVRQVTLLGAGYDSRAYRFAHLLDRVRVFEVDRPAVLARKRATVQRVLGRLPAHVTYVAADLLTEDVGAVLAEQGYDVGRRTLLLVCGLLPYLPAAAVDRVLAFAAEHPRGSGIVFDHVVPDVLAGDARLRGAVQVRRRLRDLGEPLRSAISPGAAGAFLAARGLELVEHLSPDELAERYLGGSGRPYGFVHIAHARVSRADAAGPPPEPPV
jgi:methyltransferase (TIGR00027 family)